MRILFVFAFAAAASAEPARATLKVYPPDRAIAVRAPSATATLDVIPRGAARATLQVQPDDDGYWRLEAVPLAAGAVLVAGGKPLLEIVAGSGEAPAEPPALLEAGEASVEAPVPAGTAPGSCALVLANEGASIRQTFAGADVFISGEGASSRAIFAGTIAADQAGANAATVTAGSYTRSWTARVYSWRWTAERPRVSRGEPARFRLEIDGLPEGAECDVTLAATGGLQLVEAPGAFTPAGEGCWTARVREGTFVFEAPADGDAVVTADLAPVCESGK